MKKMYEKPVVYVIECLNERSFLAISGEGPIYEENDDEWGDNGGNAKEYFFEDGGQEGFNFEN